MLMALSCAVCVQRKRISNLTEDDRDLIHCSYCRRLCRTCLEGRHDSMPIDTFRGICIKCLDLPCNVNAKRDYLHHQRHNRRKCTEPWCHKTAVKNLGKCSDHLGWDRGSTWDDFGSDDETCDGSNWNQYID